MHLFYLQGREVSSVLKMEETDSNTRSALFYITSDLRIRLKLYRRENQNINRLMSLNINIGNIIYNSLKWVYLSLLIMYI
jgi:hypothetical protein